MNTHEAHVTQRISGEECATRGIDFDFTTETRDRAAALRDATAAAAAARGVEPSELALRIFDETPLDDSGSVVVRVYRDPEDDHLDLRNLMVPRLTRALGDRGLVAALREVSGAGDGELIVTMALPDDRLSDCLAQIADGAAVVFAMLDNGRVRWRVFTDEPGAPTVESLDLTPAHPLGELVRVTARAEDGRGLLAVSGR
ncbi:hypothetical protein [Corynebacterium pygosceleis]|uniref:Uncharacterized protein n=1 Tax=Corynebacterium pygosceleis TaxID=2800406 RepID=A0A9Q4GJP2_9CORY|nr:hypothetical protein [Corynebacterium pygosceleis]MCK7636594.1 hypothetical protein [Corynebacterium pygosceleis]MCK7675168.1 hypothetical protein [Corynebacterium pygosceleis]MCL0120617.1 hypothetical protein [Corynebacterium pygosceleis]MCX7467347.1 hypothetical protein [Corynebacterium pygosceleis]